MVGRMNKLDLKKMHITRFIIILLFIASINYLAGKIFFRLDLTTEKRYTLKDVSKKILRDLDDVIYIEVYLTGDLPLSFKQFSKNIREQLEEYRVYAGNNLQYEFINPSEETNTEARNKYYTELAQRGLKPINYKDKDDEGGSVEKIIFPGAIIRYHGREYSLNLLNNAKGVSGEENLNSSIETLEYEFMTGIHNLINEKPGKIAFIEGHGELDQFQSGDLARAISVFFQIDRGRINALNCLDGYKSIIIAKPIKPFSEFEKFVIDQYIMQGGKVMWYIDAVNIDMDSLAEGGTAMALIATTNLDDMLFKYGVRLNPVLVKDLHCNLLPINTGRPGQSQFTPTPWPYYPMLTPPQDHLLTKGIDLIKTEFASSIDTLANKGVRKQILLSSSVYSKSLNAPLVISLAEVGIPSDPRLYNQGNLPIAVLLDGEFESAFKNRIVTNIIGNNNYKIIEQSKPTKMMIMADGDVIRNSVRLSERGPLLSPLGFDKYTNQTFGNKDFAMNVLHYLTDDAGIISLRSKDLQLRLLDRQKIKSEKRRWQIINTLLPVLFVIIAGFIINEKRRKKYCK